VKKIDVFISYRREGGRDIARLIYEKLSFKGYNTFFDFNSMRNGKFNDQIYIAIEQCKDYVLVLSDGALDRCACASDWVRLEFEHAIKHKKNIIPVVRSKDFKFPNNLPPSFQPLKELQWVLISDDYFDEGIARLNSYLSSRRPSFWKSKLFVGLIVIALLLSFFFGKQFFGDSSESAGNNFLINDTITDCPTQLYLKRYRDVGVDLEIDSKIINSYDFIYRDTIIGEDYWILPCFKTVAASGEAGCDAGIHHPVISFKFHNKSSRTIVVNYVYFEIMDYTVDSCRYNGAAIEALSDISGNVNAIIQDDVNYFMVKADETDIERGLIYNENIERELSRGVVDNKVSVVLDLPQSCYAKIRLKCKTPEGNMIFSNEINLHYIKPENGLYLPY